MKKSFTLLSAIVTILISLNASAQDEVNLKAKSYLSFFGGISTPTSNFSSTDYNNNHAAFAKKGVTFGLNTAIYVYKNLAIAATLSYQDQGELTAADVQNLSNNYNVSFNKNQTTVTATGRYVNYNLMLGPQYSFLYKKFTLDIGAAAGFVITSSTPSLSIIFNSNSANSNSTINQLSGKGAIFGYGGNAGLRYSLGDSWDIGLKVNYINANGIKIANTNNPGTTGRFVTKLPITEIQTTLGITLKF